MEGRQATGATYGITKLFTQVGDGYQGFLILQLFDGSHRERFSLVRKPLTEGPLALQTSGSARTRSNQVHAHAPT